jgi:hypothetical protein
VRALLERAIGRERQPERGQIIGTSARVAGLAAVATLDMMQARQANRKDSADRLLLL